jgi:dTDP-4-dehydrorhamnose reductase
MRLLVTGCSGQVAQALRGLSRDGVQVVALGRPELDITDPASVTEAILRHQPEAVVNPAAYTAVDKAESEEAAAFAVNATGAGHVAAAAAAQGLPVIHISTDYVFSGDKAAPYLETDLPGPQSAYGRTKLAGEVAVAGANPRHVILRTAWVYSPYGANFLRTMLRLASSQDTLRVVADQFGTPTYAPDIADGILAVARRLRDQNAPSGVFHMVAAGDTNWAGFAQEIFRQSADRGGPSARVEPITSAEYPTAARRPASSRLDTARFRATFGHELPPWQDGVRRCLDALQANGA